jgi:hypothetical protein
MEDQKFEVSVKVEEVKDTLSMDQISNLSSDLLEYVANDPKAKELLKALKERVNEVVTEFHEDSRIQLLATKLDETDDDFETLIDECAIDLAKNGIEFDNLDDDDIIKLCCLY